MKPLFRLALGALLLPCLSSEALAQGGPPFMSELATGRGVTLARPYGLGLVYMNADQDLVLDNLVISSDTVPARRADFVQLSDSRLKSDTLLLKGDVWLFPFLNLFAFVGQASNEVDARYSFQGDDLAASVGSGACSDPSNRPAFCDQTFTGTVDRKADATQYGAGASLAWARGPAFALLSLVYADTDSSATQVEAFNATPRLGWRWPLAAGGELALYGGASFIDSKVEVHREVVVTLPTPNGVQNIDIDLDVAQKNDDSWSYLGGFSWDISRALTLQAEYSVGAREGLLSTLVWRFGGE